MSTGILRPQAAMLTLYGDYLLSSGGEIGIGSLIKLLGNLGLSQQAVRSAVSRMCRAGLSRAEPPFSQEAATAEAGRCLRCDLRLLFSKPILAPKEELWVEFTAENVSQVPETEGVYQLLDEEKNIIYIKGAMNLHRELEEQLEVQEKACYFM